MKNSWKNLINKIFFFFSLFWRSAFSLFSIQFEWWKIKIGRKNMVNFNSFVSSWRDFLSWLEFYKRGGGKSFYNFLIKIRIGGGNLERQNVCYRFSFSSFESREKWRAIAKLQVVLTHSHIIRNLLLPTFWIFGLMRFSQHASK
jgi:hypothetical protein